MRRILYCLVLILMIGCSGGQTPNDTIRKSTNQTEDGGVQENPDREKAEAFLVALKNVKSAEEERDQMSEFGEWLKRNHYKVRIETKNGKHEISCPYFPPDTPWISHLLFDTKNLELLPRLKEER